MKNQQKALNIFMGRYAETDQNVQDQFLRVYNLCGPGRIVEGYKIVAWTGTVQRRSYLGSHTPGGLWLLYQKTGLVNINHFEFVKSESVQATVSDAVPIYFFLKKTIHFSQLF